MVLMKAGQEGVSEYAISYVMHACDVRGATALYVFPTDAHVSDFSSARIGPALEASDYLDSIVVEGSGAGGKRGADRVTLKRIRDRFLYLRGARVTPSGNAAQLKSIDADVLVLDEWDEMDGRAPTIARKRLGASSIAEERDISTPTYINRGIHTEYQKTDMRQWFVPCPRCGKKQPLSLEMIVTEFDELERPTAWHGQKDGHPYAACTKCGAAMDRLAMGEWVAEYQDRPIAGFHISKLFSPNGDLTAIINALQETDETKRKETVNQDLGLPYKPRGGQLTMETLDACIRDYAHGPVAGERPFMGVDVGKVLHVVVRGPLNASGERPQRFAGEAESFAELGILMKQFNAQTVVIDAAPETHKAREFQAQWPDGRVWLARYTEGSGEERYSDPVRWDKKEGIVSMDRTRCLDMTFARFRVQENTLPANGRDLRDYYDHLLAQTRIVDDPTKRGRSGKAVARYVNDRPDHLGHAENYCTAAAMREEWVMW